MLISSDELPVKMEKDVFDIILAWINHDRNMRKNCFTELFRHVRLVCISRDSLCSDIVTNDLVTDNECCLELVKEAIGRDPFNQNSDRSDREKRTTSKGGPVFSKLFRLDRTDPLSFGPKFPEILVEWIAPIELIDSTKVFESVLCKPRKSLEAPAIVATIGYQLMLYFPTEDRWYEKWPMLRGDGVLFCHDKIYYTSRKKVGEIYSRGSSEKKPISFGESCSLHINCHVPLSKT